MPKVSAVRQIDKDTVAVAAQGNEVLVLPENIFTMCTDFLDVDRNHSSPQIAEREKIQSAIRQLWKN